LWLQASVLDTIAGLADGLVVSCVSSLCCCVIVISFVICNISSQELLEINKSIVVVTLVYVYIYIIAFPSLYWTNDFDIVIKGKCKAHFRKMMGIVDTRIGNAMSITLQPLRSQF
jgi:hypothetical protein